jgi:hypothetical protein
MRLKLIDGSTIKPLLNAQGETAAYQQILYGYVRGEYHQPGMPAPDQWQAGGDLLYLPRWTSTDSPYGRSRPSRLFCGSIWRSASRRAICRISPTAIFPRAFGRRPMA